MMTPDQMRALRRSLGLTQAEFGRVLGLTDRSVRLYETGHATPSSTIAMVYRELRDGWVPQELAAIRARKQAKTTETEKDTA